MLVSPNGDKVAYHMYFQSKQGRIFYSSGYRNHPDGTQEKHRPGAARNLRYDDKTRRLLGGTLHFDMLQGGSHTIEVEVLGTSGVHLGPGLYLGFDGRKHGSWKGPLELEGEHFANTLDVETLKRIRQVRDCPIRVTEGDAVGYGIMETIIHGAASRTRPHRREFADLTWPATPRSSPTALRAWSPRGAGITGVTTLSAGHSNETYLIDGIDEVLRMPPSEEGLLPPYDMARQHEVLVAVSKGAPAIPLPPILELCTDPAVLGDEFFLMGKIPGEAFEYAVPDWLAPSPVEGADSVCRQWFDALIALHNMPASALARRRPHGAAGSAALARRRARGGFRARADRGARRPRQAPAALFRAGNAGAWRSQARQLPVA